MLHCLLQHSTSDIYLDMDPFPRAYLDLHFIQVYKRLELCSAFLLGRRLLLALRHC